MSYPWLSGLALAKLVTAFGLFFLLLPARLLPQTPGPLSTRLHENFMAMAAITVVLVHLLALAGIYSTLLLLFVVAALSIAVALASGPGKPTEQIQQLWQRGVVWTLDMADGRIDAWAPWRLLRARFAAAVRDLVGDPARLIHVSLFTAILLVAGGLRFADAFRSAAVGYSDPYTHLLFMKQLQVSVIYAADGALQFYPRGFHAFAAVLDGLTALDGALAMRLIGPLVGTLLVAGVYYVGRRVSGDGTSALVGMFVYGILIGPLNLLQTTGLTPDLRLVTGEGSPAWFTRQTAPLTFEFALLFLMPTAFALQAWLREGLRRDLLLAGAGMLLVTMSNLGVAAIAGFVALLALLMPAGGTAAFWRARGLALLVILAAGFLGTLQYSVGSLFSSGTLEAARQLGVWLAEYGEMMPLSLDTVVSASAGLMILAVGTTGLAGRERAHLWRYVGAILVLLAVLGEPQRLGLPRLLPPDRVALVRLFVLSAGFAVLYHGLTLGTLWRGWAWRRPLAYKLLLLPLLLTGTLWAVQFPVPQPPRYEHEVLARLGLEIKRRYPPLEWTVVSLAEDFSKVFRDRGWHMNAGDFLATYDPYDPDPRMPTPYVFLFVEKRLYPQSSDGTLNRPGVRRDLERRLHEWANIYGLLHSGLTIYHEDWDVIVYLIETTQRQERAPET
jgi:hypothetical protein